MISIKFVDKMGDDFRVFEAAKATLGGEEESGFVRGGDSVPQSTPNMKLGCLPVN